MAITLTGYYDRFDATKHYDRHLFLAEPGKNVLQAAELNELQSASQERLRGIADALLNDGAVMSGADILTTVDGGTCTVDCKAGAIYVSGAVRGVTPRTFAVTATGKVVIGIYLTETVITPADDATLYDPAVHARNQGRPGASRLRVDIAWGYADEPGATGTFYPVYTIEDGSVMVKLPPPQVDAVQLALSRYDRQSTGGMYVSDGLEVLALQDQGDVQYYSLSAGTARIRGEEIIFEQGRRFHWDPTPDTLTAVGESHIAAPSGTTTVAVAHPPIAEVTLLAVVKQWTNGTYTHNTGTDNLLTKFGETIPGLSTITSILSLKAGVTTYTENTHFTFAGGIVTWISSAPANGTTMTITFHYRIYVQPDSGTLTDTGFQVSGIVASSAIEVHYAWKIPRYDLVCMDQAGEIIVIPGLSRASNPLIPPPPSGLLGIAAIYQDWLSATRTVVPIATRMVSMQELQNVRRRIETLFALVAEERLVLDMTVKDQSSKKGVFSDPFFDDDLRDQGIEQTASIFNEELTVSVDVDILPFSLGTSQSLVLAAAERVLVSQPLKTGSMKVNPYDSFAPLPGAVTLEPATDFWTDFQTSWKSPITRQLITETEQTIYQTGTRSSTATTVTSSSNLESVQIEKLGTKYVELQYLRSIPVRFKVTGFGPASAEGADDGEELTAVTFDGVPVSFTATVPF